jgi:hypothetical protein
MAWGAMKDIANQMRLERRTQGTGVGDDEAEAVAVHGEAPDDQILVRLGCGGLRQGVAVGIDLNQFSGGDQLLQAGVKLSARLSM